MPRCGAPMGAVSTICPLISSTRESSPRIPTSAIRWYSATVKRCGLTTVTTLSIVRPLSSAMQAYRAPCAGRNRRRAIAPARRSIMHRGTRSGPPSRRRRWLPRYRQEAVTRMHRKCRQVGRAAACTGEAPRPADPGGQCRCGTPRPIRVHLRTFACICVSRLLCRPPLGEPSAPCKRRSASPSQARHQAAKKDEAALCGERHKGSSFPRKRGPMRHRSPLSRG